MLEIHSKDRSMYDYAGDYYKIAAAIEKEENREVTPEERLLIFAILDLEEREG